MTCPIPALLRPQLPQHALHALPQPPAQALLVHCLLLDWLQDMHLPQPPCLPSNAHMQYGYSESLLHAANSDLDRSSSSLLCLAHIPVAPPVSWHLLSLNCPGSSFQGLHHQQDAAHSSSHALLPLLSYLLKHCYCQPRLEAVVQHYHPLLQLHSSQLRVLMGLLMAAGVIFEKARRAAAAADLRSYRGDCPGDPIWALSG